MRLGQLRGHRTSPAKPLTGGQRVSLRERSFRCAPFPSGNGAITRMPFIRHAGTPILPSRIQAGVRCLIQIVRPGPSFLVEVHQDETPSPPFVAASAQPIRKRPRGPSSRHAAQHGRRRQPATRGRLRLAAADQAGAPDRVNRPRSRRYCGTAQRAAPLEPCRRQAAVRTVCSWASPRRPSFPWFRDARETPGDSGRWLRSHPRLPLCSSRIEGRAHFS